MEVREGEYQLYLAIKFNKHKLPEKFKLLIIKAIKLALYESQHFESEYSIFNTTKKNYNLKSEIAHITWYYNLFIREINDTEYLPGIMDTKNNPGFIIDDFSYKDVFKKFLNLFQYVFITDSLTSQESKDADIIIMLDEFMVIRKDL